MSIMKKFPRHFAALIALLSAAWSATAADGPLTYKAKPGSKMRLEGTSTIHDWYSESTIIGGTLELDPAFPTDPGVNSVPAGPLKASASVNISANSFRCQWGKPMDSVMHEALDAKNHPKITYKLSELVFKEAKDGALVFDSKGEITVKGVTKPLAVPVSIHRENKDTLRIKGAADLKMTDFGIKPPAPAIALGAIKTSEDVKITFEWLTVRSETAPAAK